MTYASKWWLPDTGRIRPTAPMPFEIPRGYKSMRLDVEMSLEELWAGEKKFLRQFHKVPTRAQGREYAFNGEFNERVKEEAE